MGGVSDFKRVIHFDNVQTQVADRVVLDGISLRIAPGELVALLGASGAGKTTLLRLVNRMSRPCSGQVRVAGQDIAEQNTVQLRRGIGYVLQHFGLLPHRTAAENVGLVPRLLGWPSSAVGARASELLGAVGLPPRQYAGRYPSQLSGGEKQRVGLARALAARPKVMLMDEPFGALDLVTRSELQTLYRGLHDTLGLTTLLVTHDIAEALLLGDRIAVLDGGKLVQCAPPNELLSAPASQYVADLLTATRSQHQTLTHLLAQAQPLSPARTLS